MARFRKLSRKLIRRLFGLTVSLGICAMLMPLPMAPVPSNSPEKDQSQPFPCQNRPCGCRSAEQCWKKCCCFSNSQKIAWAKANSVKVPDYVVAAAEKEKLTSAKVCSLPREDFFGSNRAESSRVCSRCDSKLDNEHSVACDRGQAGSVDGSKQGKCCQRKSEHVKEAPSRNSSSKWVMAVYSAECQGQSPSVYCSIVLVIPGWQELAPAMPSPIEVCSIESERMLSATLRPPVPPPKIAETSLAVSCLVVA